MNGFSSVGCSALYIWGGGVAAVKGGVALDRPYIYRKRESTKKATKSVPREHAGSKGEHRGSSIFLAVPRTAGSLM